MGNNRKLPFGYLMELGEVTIHEEEAECVRWIFQVYLEGVSFKSLAASLQGKAVPYEEDRPWNKNMVARILADSRYIGEKEYPVIIPKAQFDAAQTRRSERIASPSIKPTQKELRRLCGGTPPAFVEGQVLSILDHMIKDPECINWPGESQLESPQVRRMRSELDEILHSPPVDRKIAKELAFQLAAIAMDSIGPEENETHRLRRLFANRLPMEELDGQLLRESVQKIEVKVKDKEVTVYLKNGQQMRGGITE